jgi:hypothetical protein
MEYVAILLRVREVTSSNLTPVTDNRDSNFHYFHNSLQDDVEIVPQMKL